MPNYAGCEWLEQIKNHQLKMNNTNISAREIVCSFAINLRLINIMDDFKMNAIIYVYRCGWAQYSRRHFHVGRYDCAMVMWLRYAKQSYKNLVRMFCNDYGVNLMSEQIKHLLSFSPFSVGQLSWNVRITRFRRTLSPDKTTNRNCS